jgi:hypothetical protein
VSVAPVTEPRYASMLGWPYAYFAVLMMVNRSVYLPFRLLATIAGVYRLALPAALLLLAY